MTLLALALAYSGFCSLCLAMDRHHADLFGTRPSAGRARLLYWGGWTLLALALWLSIAAHGVAVGSVLWVGLLSVAAVTLVLLLTYRPRLAAVAALATPPLAILLSSVAA
jgi:hypothetical protein